MKPSKTQTRILVRMADGERLCFMKGLHGYAHFIGDYTRNVSYHSVFALEDGGFIRRTKEDWKGFEYILTENGKEITRTKRDRQ